MVRLPEENKQAIFEQYTVFDIDIAKIASKYGLYLIGGTAIDLWCNYHNISSWRSRSNNDLDFWSYADNYDELNKFSQKMKTNTKFIIFLNFLLKKFSLLI